MTAEKDVPQVNCASCRETISVAGSAVLQDGNDFYCSSCWVEIGCANCGKELTLTREKVAEVNGNPICVECENEETESTDQGGLLRSKTWKGAILNTTTTMLGLFLVIGLVGYWWNMLVEGYITSPIPLGGGLLYFGVVYFIGNWAFRFPNGA